MNEMYVAPELEVLEVMVEQGFQATEAGGATIPGEDPAPF